MTICCLNVQGTNNLKISTHPAHDMWWYKQENTLLISKFQFVLPPKSLVRTVGRLEFSYPDVLIFNIISHFRRFLT